jgi:hypothetical protein
MSSIHRNRVIYQSEALFISPDSTGYHFTGKGGYGLMTPPLNSDQAAGGVNAKGQMVGWRCGDQWPNWNPDGSDANYAEGHGSIIKQLKRIQSANYGFTINKQDINQFGQLSKLDSIVIDSPTVNLDFSYYLLDGYNERMLEFVTNGQTNALSGAMSPELYQAGHNFFILTVPEARDAIGADVTLDSEGKDEKKTVISLGNGFLTDYSIDISVGSIPTVSCTVEGMNIRSDIGATGLDLPSVDTANSALISDAWLNGERGKCKPASAAGCTGLFSLPQADSGYAGCEDTAALRPGDVVLDLAGQSLISQQVTGSLDAPVRGSAHIQSCSINLPLARTTLQRLGSTFGFSKSIDFPLTATFNISATLSDLREGNMVDLLCGCDEHEVSVTVFDPECFGCDVKSDVPAIKFTLKGARLESENFSSSIGENKSVDLVFSTQIGGADDAARGLFLWGKENTQASIAGIPPAWINEEGEENVPFFSEVPPDAEPYNISRKYLAGKVIQVGTKYYESKVAMNHIN